MKPQTRIVTLAALAAAMAPLAAASAQFMPATRVVPSRMMTQEEPPLSMDPGEEPDMSAEPPPEDMGAMAEPAPAAPPGMGAPFTPQETDVLKRMLESLDPSGQDAIRAYYRDLGIDLDQALGLAAAKSQQAQRGSTVAVPNHAAGAKENAEGAVREQGSLNWQHWLQGRCARSSEWQQPQGPRAT